MSFTFFVGMRASSDWYGVFVVTHLNIWSVCILHIGVFNARDGAIWLYVTLYICVRNTAAVEGSSSSVGCFLCCPVQHQFHERKNALEGCLNCQTGKIINSKAGSTSHTVQSSHWVSCCWNGSRPCFCPGFHCSLSRFCLPFPTPFSRRSGY